MWRWWSMRGTREQTMYDELVKRMRKCATEAGACKTCELYSNPSCTDVLMEQAADAIEELIGFVQEAERDRDEYRERLDNANELMQKRWIPVTERLPEREKKTYWVCTDTGYQCECRWTNNQFGIGVSDEWGWSIFDIPYQKVAAWMSLPDPYEPPKEESYGV